ncbi:autotransporter outer membrane beta-barrel domain-containing protein [Hansschlegelia sp. KR7-227]|uniref:autotransporter outer membrane beta-barrel domain-containing protein n=1 Tax=Hansschlegelia sp. KR7-227 TaxID=3400914 RepID=UPI003C074B56
MGIHASRVGLMLGVVGALCASQARAADIRTTQSLLESGVFLSQAEAEAALARLDADRSAARKPVPNALTYWEQGGAGYGQAERRGRAGYGGDASQFRIGADREVRTGLVLGAVAGAGFGNVSSGDLGARTFSRHVDVYFKSNAGPLFAKGLIGASQFDFNSLSLGADDARCHGDAASYDLRTAGQVGGAFDLGAIKITPTATLALHRAALPSFDVKGDNGGLSFAARRATAAIGTFRLAGSRSFRIDATHKVNVEAFMGADEIVGYDATRLRAVADGARVAAAAMGSPTGRGLVGGLGVGTALAEGVKLDVHYDYSERDGVATRGGRARLGVSF